MRRMLFKIYVRNKSLKLGKQYCYAKSENTIQILYKSDF